MGAETCGLIRGVRSARYGVNRRVHTRRASKPPDCIMHACHSVLFVVARLFLPSVARRRDSQKRKSMGEVCFYPEVGFFKLGNYFHPALFLSHPSVGSLFHPPLLFARFIADFPEGNTVLCLLQPSLNDYPATDNRVLRLPGK